MDRRNVNGCKCQAGRRENNILDTIERVAESSKKILEKISNNIMYLDQLLKRGDIDYIVEKLKEKGGSFVYIKSSLDKLIETFLKKDIWKVFRKPEEFIQGYNNSVTSDLEKDNRDCLIDVLLDILKGVFESKSIKWEKMESNYDMISEEYKDKIHQIIESMEKNNIFFDYLQNNNSNENNSVNSELI
ncbi:MAG: hypothetical protein MHPSP_003461 [Paramarteilia canceri]